jgi:hypothetical protein
MQKFVQIRSLSWRRPKIKKGVHAAAMVSFTANSIANCPGITAEGLAGAIIIRLPAMPTVQLVRGEIRDVTAYILSLKRND